MTDTARPSRLATIRFSQLALVAAIIALLLYYGAFAILFANGVTVNISLQAALELASRFRGLFGLSYLMQGLAFLLWALVAVAWGQVFRRYAPGVALLAAVVGAAGFVWRALSDLARAGSMEYLGQLYGVENSTGQLFAEFMGAWTQLWTFGAIWELLSNALALGAFLCLAGLLLVAGQARVLGWIMTFLGGVVGLSFLASAVYYILGVSAGLLYISAPGTAAVAIGPLVLVLLAWLADRTAATSAPDDD